MTRAARMRGALALACGLGPAAAALAQGLVGREIGPMELRVCDSLEAASDQADRSWEVGKGAIGDRAFARSLRPGCAMAFVTVRPSAVERNLGSFEGWTLAYDAGGKLRLPTEGGEVPGSYRRQQITYYRAAVNDGGGWRDAWIELPAEPYLLAHQAATGIAAKPAEPAPAAEGGRWQPLDNDPACTIWNQAPQADETASWSGRCRDGRAEGGGTLVWRFRQDGEPVESRYVGDMRGGKAHGRGILQLPNGDRYEGEWRDDMFNGRGVYQFSNGERYEGEWLDSMRHGRGVYSFPEGDRYDGEWREGRRHGRGTYHFQGGESCEGDWQEDVLVGTGEAVVEGRRQRCHWETETYTIHFTE